MAPLNPKILVAESNGFSDRAFRQLQLLGEVFLADLDRPALLSRVREADVLWVRLRYRIDAEVLERAPILKFIVTPTTGLNHIDLDEAERRGIRVLSLRGEIEFLREVRATAELTLGLMIALLRRIPAAVTHVKSGGWERDLFKGFELFGKRVGIVGYGRLGRIVSRYLRSFDVEVCTNSPGLDPTCVEEGVRVVQLNELLREVDLVTLHVNLTNENRGFFGAPEFELMKEGAWFVNSSRGELVDERALLDSLTSGHLAGAALDVVCGEHSTSLAGHSLIAYAATHDNLIITPHIGGCTNESMEKSETFLAERLSILINGATR